MQHSRSVRSLGVQRVIIFPDNGVNVRCSLLTTGRRLWNQTRLFMCLFVCKTERKLWTDLKCFFKVDRLLV